MIRLQREDFDIGAEIDRLVGARTDIGAVVTFSGLVRDLAGVRAGGRPVGGIELEHYPAMAMRELEAIEREALTRWPLQGSLIIHRFGRLAPGERIVLVVTASAHRGEAFAAAEFLMDYLKTRAPFWKREATAQGPLWVEAADKDTDALKRWRE